MAKATETPEMVYVTIPEKDLFGDPHPGVGSNQEHFGPGTHLVSKELAVQIENRLAAFHKSSMRRLTSFQHLESIGQTPDKRGGYIPPDQRNNG